VKIIPKLTLALFAGTSVILAVNGVLRVERERDYFDADRVRGHEMIGRSLAAATEAVWRTDGERAARQAIDAVSVHVTTMQIRWVGADDASTLDVDPVVLIGTPAGQPITRVTHGRTGDAWDTIVPLDVGGARRGIIELTEPMTSEQRFVRNTIIETAAMAVTLAIVSATLSFLMGQWLVGARVRALSDKARRIGLGDFSGPVVLRQHDELTDLAREVNAMSDRLVTTLQQLRHADRLATVGKLASGVAHELGTPLNVVSARARMIADGEASSEEAREYAGVIVGATERMTKTIRQLMQFARRGKVEKARRDLRELARETLDLLKPLAGKRRIVLDLEKSDLDATLSVDGGQIQQVITNLTMNAIQAVPDAGRVELGLFRERVCVPAEVGGEVGGAETSVLCLRVSDTGAGIAPEHLQHVFEPFFTTKDVGEGTGLGLAVAYGIIREHGGWIAVESRVGSGTTFSVFLPAPDPHEPASPSGR
jgi:two-component system, NtrC family, sensor kinase